MPEFASESDLGATPESPQDGGTAQTEWDSNREAVAVLMLDQARQQRDHQNQRLAFFRKAASAVTAAHFALSSLVLANASDPPDDGLTAVVVSAVVASAFALRINSPIKGWSDGPSAKSMDAELYVKALPQREARRAAALTLGKNFKDNEQLLKSRLRGFKYLVGAVLVGYIALIASTA